MSTEQPDRPRPGPEVHGAAESPCTPPGSARRPGQGPEPRQGLGHGRASTSPSSSPRPAGSQADSAEAASAEAWKPPPVDARDMVRIFQCRICSMPYQHAVTLPCGRSICASCLPETHARTSITYPALPSRMLAFACPFADCQKEHVLDDCGADVILNKLGGIVAGAMTRHQARAVELHQSTSIPVESSWAETGIAPGAPDEDGRGRHRTLIGTPLVATWTLAVDGGLAFDADVDYSDSLSTPRQERFNKYDAEALGTVQHVMRAEMDCQICYALFHDPLTTGCGHTFCRPCLQRILDHSRYCPICRRKLAINSLLKPSSSPSNERLLKIIQTFWEPEMLARQEAVDAERVARLQDLQLPLFVCTLAFPMMPTFLHVFEPRYRLMIRRVLEGDKTFGMVLPKRPHHSGDAHFYELGTLLRIVNAQFYPDGRSLIETVGLSRFRVGRHGQLDGYTVGRTERIDDVSLEEEEAAEAAEVGLETEPGHQRPHDDDDDDISSHDRRAEHPLHSRETLPSQGSTIPTPQSIDGVPRSVADLNTMTTQSLMQFCVDFVARMSSQSVPWLTERMVAIYGECPDDPAIFPWWFASMLPVRDLEKYRLLETATVRERLKICASWVIEMETVRWYDSLCPIWPGRPRRRPRHLLVSQHI